MLTLHDLQDITVVDDFSIPVSGDRHSYSPDNYVSDNSYYNFPADDVSDDSYYHSPPDYVSDDSHFNFDIDANSESDNEYPNISNSV